VLKAFLFSAFYLLKLGLDIPFSNPLFSTSCNLVLHFPVLHFQPSKICSFLFLKDSIDYRSFWFSIYRSSSFSQPSFSDLLAEFKRKFPKARGKSGKQKI